jgi:hypothetical protein
MVQVSECSTTPTMIATSMKIGRSIVRRSMGVARYESYRSYKEYVYGMGVMPLLILFNS